MFLIFLVSVVGSSIITPTIINSTGEFYIADKNSFKNNSIECNSTNNCYIICSLDQSCYNTKIFCESAECNLMCSGNKSCHGLQFSLNNSNTINVNLLCNNIGSCSNTKINSSFILSRANKRLSTFTANCINQQSCYNNSWTLNNFNLILLNYTQCYNCFENINRLFLTKNINIIHNTTTTSLLMWTKSNMFESIPIWTSNTFRNVYQIKNSDKISVSCIGPNACAAHKISTNNDIDYSSFVEMQCNQDTACYGIVINQSLNDALNLSCNSSQGCKLANLLVSPLSNHTNIICNANVNSQACSNLDITVSSNYQQDFIVFQFINDQDQNVPLQNSFDDVNIQCIDSMGNHKFCTNYTRFPLLYGRAIPSHIIDDKVYFNGNTSYKYQFQSLTCESGQECFVYCNADQTCSNTLIDCKNGSNCKIFCDDSNECKHTVVGAYGDEIDFICINPIPSVFGKACVNTTLWIPDKFDNGFLNISSCDQYQSCDNLNFMCNNNTSSYFKWNQNIHKYECENKECCPWNSNSSIIHQNITCDLNVDCIIKCNNNWGNPYYPPYGCNNLEIDGSNAKSLNVDCSSLNSYCQDTIIYCPVFGDNGTLCEINCGSMSCINTTIHANNTTNININCLATNSCHHININAYNIDSFKMKCNGTCNNSNINIYSSNSMVLDCDQCFGSKLNSIFVGNVYLDCNQPYSCSDMTIITNFTQNVSINCNYNGDYYALNNACLNTKIYVNSINNFNINCNKSSCTNTFIAAITTYIDDVDTINRNNISIMCLSYESCKELTVNISDIFNVLLKCNAWNSCLQSRFDIKNSKFLNVITNNTDKSGGTRSIDNSLFNLDSIGKVSFDFSLGQGYPVINGNNINNMDLVCNTSNGHNIFPCQYLKLNMYNVNDSVNVFCDGMNSCQHNSINIGFIHNISNLWCNGKYSCTFIQYHVLNPINISNITCNGHNSCISTTINGKYAKLLNIYSDSNYLNGNDYGLTIITTKQINSTNIYCKSKGCWLENLIISSLNGFGDINFIWSGDCQCNTIADCIDEWNLTCANDKYITFDGKQCIPSNSNCCKNQDIVEIETAFKNYYYGNISNCYVPSNHNKKLKVAVLCVVIIVPMIVIISLAYFAWRYYKKKQHHTQTEIYQEIQ